MAAGRGSLDQRESRLVQFPSFYRPRKIFLLTDDDDQAAAAAFTADRTPYKFLTWKNPGSPEREGREGGREIERERIPTKEGFEGNALKRVTSTLIATIAKRITERAWLFVSRQRFSLNRREECIGYYLFSSNYT